MHQKHCCLILLFVLLTACANHSANDTAYAYHIADAFAEVKPKKLVIAHVNLGPPSKNYLQDYQNKIDNEVTRVLLDAGYQIADQPIFKNIWRNAIRKYGEPYNTYTSQQNASALRRVVSYTLAEMKKSSDIDAIVFTDLVEQSVVFSGRNQMARWHGVSRKPRVKGGNSISAAFDWSQTVPAVSLRVVIYNVRGELLFNSFGGLEVARELNVQRERFMRRDKLFVRAKNVEQGVSIALHPFAKIAEK